MPLRNNDKSYGSVAKLLHWSMFLAFAAVYAIAIYMSYLPMGPSLFETITLHKSIGLLIMGLALVRIGWRLFNKSPALPADMPMHERFIAHAAHLALYAIMIGMPLSGWAMSSAANFPASFFGLFTLPSIMTPSKEAVDLLKAIHWYAAWGIGALILAHVGAALKHHFINRDTVLSRMLPFHKG